MFAYIINMPTDGSLIDIFDKEKDKIIEQFIEFDKYISTENEIGF